ncbi:hypothetical protein [Roseomonas indoligenes]|uniref:Uncharacterized protein n=1 Tax=Roseomonas indoligenes TaxID=2820811 RepID=A0A940N0T8_9PROT|nr:hypothetical protein [Pararoseomonas indoligenes]MBP0493996.1 hypothetical protein [Pararoseomonas indoligenes]
MTPKLRVEMGRKAEELLDEARAAMDGAAYLIGFLDAADRPVMDLEPDCDGEDEPEEASAQPVTLAPDRVCDTVHRPTRRQMVAAYRRVGAPVPANLRGLFGRAWA